MAREDITAERARAKGRMKVEGSTSIMEYRHGLLDIRYRADRGQLDVWFDRRVLSVESFRRNTHVIQYAPGHWELDLIRAAKIAA